MAHHRHDLLTAMLTLSRVKRWFMLTHRWLGVGMCVLFFLWFLSGMVMMYAGHPKLSYQERLDHLPPLDLQAALLSPAEALRTAGLDTHAPTEALSLANTRAGQPIYVLREDRRTFIAIDAKTGQRVPPTDRETALASAQVYWEHSPSYPAGQKANAPGSTLQYLGTINEDAHTHSHAMNGHRPLHLVKLPDEHDTLLYISGTTGEVVRDAPQPERALNYLGSWLHWLYAFRDTAIDWTNLIIILSVIGTITGLTGLVSGIIRWRFAGTYRSGSHSPFPVGAMRWHHILGMAFAVTTITFVFSGLMSMAPWGIFDSEESPIDPEAISSQRIKPYRARATPQLLLKSVSVDSPNTDAVMTEAAGAPATPAARAETPAANAAANAAEHTAENKAARADAATAAARARVVELQWKTVLNKTVVLPILASGGGDGTRMVAAKDALPYQLRTPRLQSALFGLSTDLPPQIETVTRYDFYYYTRAEHTMMGGRREHPLPIWRVYYNDPQQTWLHVDPATGTVLGTLDNRARAERWLFALLHSWDWLPLLSRRPLWDLVMLALNIGGLLLSATGIWVGVHRTHLKWKSWRYRRARAAKEKLAQVPPAMR